MKVEYASGGFPFSAVSTAWGPGAVGAQTGFDRASEIGNVLHGLSLCSINFYVLNVTQF